MAKLHLHFTATPLGGDRYRVLVEDADTHSSQTIEPIPASSPAHAVDRVLEVIMGKLPAGARVVSAASDSSDSFDCEEG